MIRFIDLRGQKTGYRFAFWDTTQDKFTEFGGDSAWNNDVDFFEAFNIDGGYYVDHIREAGIERFSALMPEWTNDSPDSDIL